MASRENIMFYFDPSQVVAGKAPLAKRFRIGGMVVKGSVERKPGDLEVRFVLTDFAHQVPVEYTDVLPDLFREGQGIIAHGTMNASGAFVADEVLAKPPSSVRGMGSGSLGPPPPAWSPSGASA
jgi:cytochrome c-type biogenesis protein CcmE